MNTQTQFSDKAASDTRLYGVWINMNKRCHCITHLRYNRYGKRGIIVCAEWRGRGKFLNFHNWAIANGYKEGLTIERIDNDGNYCPENCRWATWEEQRSHRSEGEKHRNITYNGEVKTIAGWARFFKLSRYLTKKKLGLKIS
jgi:hypothetical protein